MDEQPDGDIIADYAREVQEQEIAKFKAKIKQARMALFIAAALLFIGEMVPMIKDANGFDPVVFIISIAISSAFFVLGLWTKKKPFTAIVTGLVAFIGYILLVIIINGINDGSAGVAKGIFTGIIIKVILLGYLISALKDAKTLQGLMENKY